MIRVFFILATIFLSLPAFPQQHKNCFTQDTGPDPVYAAVEVNPVYPGGYEAFYKFLIENIKYPDTAKITGLQGTVYLSFVVEKDGKVSNVKVLKGIGGGCDEEAVRVIKLLPVWTPGYCDNQPVRVLFSIPFQFKLSENKKTQAQ